MEESLEKQFEQDFSRHLEKKNGKTRLAHLFVGAGVGGAIGVAASPVLLPGVAVASLVGATGGYHLAKRRGRKEQRRHRPGAEPADDAAAGLPTLRRLKYLVKWGHWQLLEYEDAAAERRCRVLDEVVCAFSPWVQKMYLLRAKRHASEDDPEAREVFQHLAPLYYFLQRRATLEAINLSVKAVASSFEAGAADAECARRCFVSFPSILETISILDRLSSAMHEKLATDISASKARGVKTADRTNKRQRLKRIVGLICEVLQRPDVQEACSDRRSFEHRVAVEEAETTQEVAEAEAGQEAGEYADNDELVTSRTSSENDPVSPSACSRGRRRVRLALPPQGAEDEQPDGDQDPLEYFSMSEDSMDEAGTSSRAPARRRPQHGALPPPAPGAGGPRAGDFRTRAAAFPQGTVPHTWTAFDPSNFEVRSTTYLKDRRKCPAGAAMTELVSVDFMLIGSDGPVWRACEHPDFFPAHSRAAGDKRLFVVNNWIFPPYQCVITGAVDPSAPWLLDGDGPQARVWRKFLEADNEGRRDLFKMIGAVEQGPWLVRRALPKKPVLIGKKVRMDTFHEPGQYIEIVFDVASGRAEKYATGIVCSSLKRLQLAFSALLEAREEEELPESLLLSATCLNLDPARLYSPCGPTSSESAAGASGGA